MPMSHNPVFSIADRAQRNHLVLKSPEGHVVHLFVLEEDVIRVLLLPDGAPHFPQTWAIAPGQPDVPYAGRSRFDLSGFALPDYRFEENEAGFTITTTQLRLNVQRSGFFCRWEMRKGRQGRQGRQGS